MNPADMIRLLDSIAQDRNIDRNLLLQDLEEAMKSAARKHFNSLDVEEFGCRVDPMTGEITMWRNVYEDIDDPDAPVRRNPSLWKIWAEFRPDRQAGDDPTLP